MTYFVFNQGPIWITWYPRCTRDEGTHCECFIKHCIICEPQEWSALIDSGGGNGVVVWGSSSYIKYWMAWLSSWPVFLSGPSRNTWTHGTSWTKGEIKKEIVSFIFNFSNKVCLIKYHRIPCVHTPLCLLFLPPSRVSRHPPRAQQASLAQTLQSNSNQLNLKWTYNTVKPPPAATFFEAATHFVSKLSPYKLINFNWFEQP